MSIKARPRPVDLAPAPWPTKMSPDPVGEIARQFAVRLRAALGERSIRSASADAGVNHATVIRILAGEVWPDLGTIAKLELSLGAELWPNRIGDR
ncbi:helix-turn-helix domain-containing protein [Curtobacterium flaccumfaciens]|uniref:helix-turn-helix domain-containing protein n=1 Tax=Curtobacterium flaccumfaciens TaxID=2035 RepID=UPI0022100374|nr:hypothetical protein [Curtobacterium flaccumfaciens]UWD79223.1 hypothetical protein NY058_00145 [Curtobacterium flaccumfaciens]